MYKACSHFVSMEPGFFRQNWNTSILLLRLNPGGRREKDQIARDGFEVFTVV